jgi:hypothetical protein
MPAATHQTYKYSLVPVLVVINPVQDTVVKPTTVSAGSVQLANTPKDFTLIPRVACVEIKYVAAMGNIVLHLVIIVRHKA